MFTPVLELEGTWEEITSKVPDYQNTRLQVTIQVKEKLVPMISDPDDSVWDEIFKASSKIQSKPDTRNWLREGRAGGMFPDASTE